MEMDEPPKKLSDMVIGENLELLSIAELEHRVQALEAEIARVRAEMAKKQASKSAADAVFRS